MPTPPERRVSGHGIARKSPWSLDFIVTENQSKGRWGGLDPARVMCLWAWHRSKKPLELSFHRYGEPSIPGVRGRGVVQTPPGLSVSGPGIARKSPWSLDFIVTENQSKGRWGGLDPARVMCLWAWHRSKKPLELSFHRYGEPSIPGVRGRGVVPTPPGRRVSGHGVARKSPWSLDFIVTENQSKGRWGGLDPARVMCLWAWHRSKKPLELSFHRYGEPSIPGVRGRGVVQTPPGLSVSVPGIARKSPWSLDFIVTENQSKGPWGSAHPARETCLWAWHRSKKPLELRFHRYREPE